MNHFWPFAFERFNGILRQLPNNNRSVETQTMKRFLEVMRFSMPSEFKSDFQLKPVGTVGSDAVPSVDYTLQIPHSSTRAVFNFSELDEIKGGFFSLYPISTDVDICSAYVKYSTILIEGKVYGSTKLCTEHKHCPCRTTNGDSPSKNQLLC